MIALNLFRRDEYKSQWLKRVKYILDSYGLSYMWYNQHVIPTKQCKTNIHRRIEDIALQKWNTDVSTSSMCYQSTSIYTFMILMFVPYVI